MEAKNKRRELNKSKFVFSATQTDFLQRMLDFFFFAAVKEGIVLHKV